MKKIQLLVAAACVAGVVGVSTPAKAADLCLQFAGDYCDLSGSLGFFHFMGAKLPTRVKKATALHGRACQYGTATGSSTMNYDGSGIALHANFVCDGVPGLIEAYFAPGATLGASSGSAAASYGTFDLPSSCTATIVDCANEANP